MGSTQSAVQHVIFLTSACSNGTLMVSRPLAKLGDVFPDTDLTCRVRGCPNTWNFGRRTPGACETAPDGTPRPDRLCDECWERFKRLEDREVPCSTPGCNGTWTWTRLEQLEAQRRGHRTPPKGFCEECRRRMQALEDRQAPCRMRGCNNTWTWTRRQQMLHPGEAPPQRLCDECYRRLQTLHDREVPCSIPGCTGKWVWDRYQQLEHLLQGRSLNAPPRGLCKECRELLGSLEDREEPCRVPECSRTWTFTRYMQLVHIRRNGPDAPPPQRFCRECYSFLKRVDDMQVRCRFRGCTNTWTWTRAAQLHAWLCGRSAPPRRLCEECRRRVRETPPKEMPCAVPGCSGVWTWSPEDQVQAQLLKRKNAPQKRCAECEQFLTEHSTVELKCAHCGAVIHWTPYEQLLVKLGQFRKPNMCAECAAQVLVIDKAASKPLLDHTGRVVVRMPAAGPWQKHDAVRKWPPHLTHETIAKVEAADLRIVCFGDDITWCCEDADRAWPALLEKELQKANDGVQVAVVNAGMPGSTTELGLLRFGRDVAPFQPHLVIFSFTFADAVVLADRRNGRWLEVVPDERVLESTSRLCRRLARMRGRALFWTTNPVLPALRADIADEDVRRSWAAAQEARKRSVLAEQLRVCRENGIPVLDLRTRFEVNGTESARRWMRDWRLPNEDGAENIAAWMSAYLRRSDLLPASISPK